MMPDLPNVGIERDLESFREFFESPAFRADGLKIYPTLVIRGTGLYELWKTGRYFTGLALDTEVSCRVLSTLLWLFFKFKGKNFCACDKGSESHG